jgi:hypothetical protein
MQTEVFEQSGVMYTNCQDRVSEGLKALISQGNLPTPGRPTDAGGQVRTLGFADLLPFLDSIAPSATHLVFAWLTSRYGVAAETFLRQYGPEIQKLVKPEDWAKIHELLHLIIPENTAPNVPPVVRPIFGLS